MSTALASSRHTHLSAHKPGRSLAAAVQSRQRPLIEARVLLTDSLSAHSGTADRFAAIFATRAPNQFTRIPQESIAERAAWALINMYLLGTASGAPVSHSLRSAEDWFLNGRSKSLGSLAECIEPSLDRAAAMLLSVVTIDSEFRALLPYILEPFDFAHRLNAKRCSTFGERRSKKRTSGTFYTPGDVAATVTGYALGFALEGGRVLDPACGTGVFLLSLLRELRQREPDRTPLQICNERLYGIDISELAIESCAFVLAHDCLSGESEPDPWLLWHTLRQNLWAYDATAIAVGAACQGVPSERVLAKTSLRDRESVPEGFVGRASVGRALWDDQYPGRIWDVFPEAASGFEAIVSNPPYVRGLSEPGNLYIRFVDLMLRLANRERGFVGAVLPLSIAFGTDVETKRLRQTLTRSSGVCRFAFFDREPHGLFGEEVKTRSAILLRVFSTGDGPARVQTTPLLRLTSRTRAELLQSLPSVEIRRSDIREGIPKIGSPIEADALERLSPRETQGESLEFVPTPFATCLSEEDAGRVYIGPVAYNFLNIARCLKAPATEPQFRATQSNFLRCDLKAQETADAVFALFSSRIAYWLWNVEGDGFHVSRRFVGRIAGLWSQFSVTDRAELAAKGRALWSAVAEAPVISVNAGAWSIAFSPLRHQQLVTEIDRVVASSLGLPDDFVSFLESAIVERIIVSPTELKRRQLVGQE